jgi:Phytanoyl-CoA dioxygenase (PhyH)
MRRIGPDPAILAWAKAARPLAVQALAATDQPLRCGGTWAVGLDLLPNAADGSVDGTPLPWRALGLPPEPLHAAQLSCIHPGYPQPSPDETPAALAYRQRRDAAHLDGLLPIGPARRRMVKEPHGFILGLALTGASKDAAPLTVWPGSSAIMRQALQAAFAPYPPDAWGDVDVTDAYQAARAKVFTTCPRVEVPLVPGEAVLLHRLTLHGVAPWSNGASAAPEGRIIAYFRPLMPRVADWIA